MKVKFCCDTILSVKNKFSKNLMFNVTYLFERSNYGIFENY